MRLRSVSLVDLLLGAITALVLVVVFGVVVIRGTGLLISEFSALLP